MTTVELQYDDAGEGAAVVFVHGHPFDRSMWQPQQPLARRFRIVAPDLRGYGSSPATPGVVSMRELAQDVWALVDRLELQRIAVVGLSMGGLVAMEMSLARPDDVSALALVATTAQPVTEEEAARRRALADAVEREGMQPLLDDMLPRLFGTAPPPAAAQRVRAMMAANQPQGSAAALRGRAERPDYRARLPSLQMPSFVCVGERDAWSTAEVTEELVGCLADPRLLVLPDVGHLPNLERPEEFNAALETFLEGAGARRAP
jgi:pimeloyl-ACP methyl ester carboxylesterase